MNAWLSLKVENQAANVQLTTKYGLKEKILNEIIQIVSANEKVNSITIFGSRAMGNFKEGSDVDIAIDAPGISHKEYLGLLRKLPNVKILNKIDLVYFPGGDKP